MLKFNAIVLTLAVNFVAGGVVQADAHEKHAVLKGIKCMLCGMQVSEKHVVEYEFGND